MSAAAPGSGAKGRGAKAWLVAVYAFLYVPIAILVIYSFNASP